MLPILLGERLFWVDPFYLLSVCQVLLDFGTTDIELQFGSSNFTLMLTDVKSEAFGILALVQRMDPQESVFEILHLPNVQLAEAHFKPVMADRLVQLKNDVQRYTEALAHCHPTDFAYADRNKRLMDAQQALVYLKEIMVK